MTAADSVNNLPDSFMYWVSNITALTVSYGNLCPEVNIMLTE